MYVRADEENGSMISGEEVAVYCRAKISWAALEKGWEERRRIAWVMVDWNRPACDGGE